MLVVNGLVPSRNHTNIIRANFDPYLCRYMALLGHNDGSLILIVITVVCQSHINRYHKHNKTAIHKVNMIMSVVNICRPSLSISMPSEMCTVAFMVSEICFSIWITFTCPPLNWMFDLSSWEIYVELSIQSFWKLLPTPDNGTAFTKMCTFWYCSVKNLDNLP